MKILIVKIGAIGDALMARGMIGAAPVAPEVTWVCGRSITPLVREFAGVSEIIEIDDAALLRGSLLSKLRVLAGAWLSLAGRRFDLIATGHSDWRYALLSATAFAGIRRSFANRRLVPGRFHGDEYARLAHGADGPQAPRARLAPLRGGRPKPKTALLFPGGAKNLLRDDALRRWPLERYRDLAKLLMKRGWKVTLAGAESDQWILNGFGHMDVGREIGTLDLPGLLDACAASQAVVTHDSGPMHLALATPARVIAIFGPTNPNEKIRARQGDAVFWGGEELACRPCYDGKTYAPCSDNRCIQGVSVAQVLAAVEGRFARQ